MCIRDSSGITLHDTGAGWSLATKKEYDAWLTETLGTVSYTHLVVSLILINLDNVPYFFSAVFKGAFTPEAVFGGAFGTVLMQG